MVDSQNIELQAFIDGRDYACNLFLDIARKCKLSEDTQKEFEEILQLISNMVKEKPVVYISKISES